MTRRRGRLTLRFCVTVLALLVAATASPAVALASTRDWTGLRTRGPEIVDQYGNNVLLRGFGPGEWTNTEAYMILWPDQDAGGGRHQSQYGYTEIHDTLSGIMDPNAAALYWQTWKANVITEPDIARMQAWGANALRLSINYHWLSPSNGKYLASGWQWIDQVVAWSKAHHIRVILCMHAAPGAQSNELMADTPDVTAHLWTQPTIYQPWTINLWQAIARRYASEPYVAGYDLLDEPIPPPGKEWQVRPFYVDVTKAIRAVDPNHMIFVEGLNFAGDARGMRAMLPPWDSNMVLDFHKYWDKNDQASIQGYLDIRNRYHVPLWNGETGENTPAWDRGMAHLLAQHNIGWLSWTFKKLHGVGSSPYSIPVPSGYDEILKYVFCLTPHFDECARPSPQRADAIMLQLANNAATSASTFQAPVVEALFGNVASTALSTNPTSRIAGTGLRADFALTLEPFGSAAGVLLHVAGLPRGATARFSPSYVRGSGTSLLSVWPSRSTPAGNYELTITGGGSIVPPVTVTLTVRASAF